MARVGSARTDGSWRVLVDRLWPRGVARERADWDEWLQAVAPSTELRKWYSHDPERRAEFVARYLRELGEDSRADALQHLLKISGRKDLTLMTSTRWIDVSHVVVLRDVLLGTLVVPGAKAPSQSP